MGDLIFRNNDNQDWINLIFLINLFYISGMFFLDPIRLKRMIKFYAIDFYISKHISEKNINYLSFFNILSFLIILNTICLLIVSFSNFSNEVVVFYFEFYYLLGILIIFLSGRFLIIKFISKQIKEIGRLKIFYFKSFTHHVQFALFLLIILFCDFNSSLSSDIFIKTYCFIGFLWFIFQSRIIISLFNSKPKEVLYIILYLCTLKFIPWYWFYLIAKELML